MSIYALEILLTWFKLISHDLANCANETFWIKVFEANKIEKPTKDQLTNLSQNLKVISRKSQDALSLLGSRDGLLTLCKYLYSVLLFSSGIETR